MGGDAIDEDLPREGVVEAGQQAGEGRFTAPGATDQGQGLPGLDHQIEVPQHGTLVHVIDVGQAANLHPPLGPVQGPVAGIDLGGRIDQLARGRRRR